MLSLSRATILPQQSEEWLESLSVAVLDYWKTGELFLGKFKDQVVFCDPIEVLTAPGSTASDDGQKFVMPSDWSKTQKGELAFVLNKPSQYSIRGVPVSYHQLVMLSRLGASGLPQAIDPQAFGFSKTDASVNVLVGEEIVQRLMMFRRRLGFGLNQLWPELTIDFYGLNYQDVLDACRRFGFF